MYILFYSLSILILPPEVFYNAIYLPTQSDFFFTFCALITTIVVSATTMWHRYFHVQILSYLLLLFTLEYDNGICHRCARDEGECLLLQRFVQFLLHVLQTGPANDVFDEFAIATVKEIMGYGSRISRDVHRLNFIFEK
jgi:hypothetical protein